MKKQVCLILLTGLMVCMGVSGIFAQDEAYEMPPMGAPDEMKALSFFVGDWDVAQEWRMTPDSDTYEKSTAKAKYYYTLDSCMLVMDYASDMMGMPFEGRYYETYDRQTKEYQSIWVDTFGARMSYYTGKKEGDKYVFTGNDYMPDGTMALFRVTVLNATETSFDWHMDFSFDEGKTFVNSGKAVYTKK